MDLVNSRLSSTGSVVKWQGAGGAKPRCEAYGGRSIAHPHANLPYLFTAHLSQCSTPFFILINFHFLNLSSILLSTRLDINIHVLPVYNISQLHVSCYFISIAAASSAMFCDTGMLAIRPLNSSEEGNCSMLGVQRC